MLKAIGMILICAGITLISANIVEWVLTEILMPGDKNPVSIIEKCVYYGFSIFEPLVSNDAQAKDAMNNVKVSTRIAFWIVNNILLIGVIFLILGAILYYSTST